jgi:hypothetical protein
MLLFQLALLTLASAASIVSVQRDVGPALANLANIAQEIGKTVNDLNMFRESPSLVNALV